MAEDRHALCERTILDFKARADAAEARLAAVEALHFATASTAGLYATNCGGCSHSWPCPTIAAACGEGDRG